MLLNQRWLHGWSVSEMVRAAGLETDMPAKSNGIGVYLQSIQLCNCKDAIHHRTCEKLLVDGCHRKRYSTAARISTRLWISPVLSDLLEENSNTPRKPVT